MINIKPEQCKEYKRKDLGGCNYIIYCKPKLLLKLKLLLCYKIAKIKRYITWHKK